VDPPDLVVRALESGANVLTEKPMALSAADALPVVRTIGDVLAAVGVPTDGA